NLPISTDMQDLPGSLGEGLKAAAGGLATSVTRTRSLGPAVYGTDQHSKDLEGLDHLADLNFEGPRTSHHWPWRTGGGSPSSLSRRQPSPAGGPRGTRRASPRSRKPRGRRGR